MFTHLRALPVTVLSISFMSTWLTIYELCVRFSSLSYIVSADNFGIYFTRCLLFPQFAWLGSLSLISCQTTSLSRDSLFPMQPKKGTLPNLEKWNILPLLPLPLIITIPFNFSRNIHEFGKKKWVQNWEREGVIHIPYTWMILGTFPLAVRVRADESSLAFGERKKGKVTKLGMRDTHT